MDDRSQATWLERRLNVDRQTVGKICKCFPSLFRHSTVSLETKLAWLRDRLGLEGPDVARLIRRCPVILGQEIDTNGYQCVQYLDGLFRLISFSCLFSFSVVTTAERERAANVSFIPDTESNRGRVGLKRSDSTRSGRMPLGRACFSFARDECWREVELGL